MNDLMARSLSSKELAEQLRYHDDAGVVRLALFVLGEDDESRSAQDAIEDAERAAADAEQDAEEAGIQCEALKDLLTDCLEELPNEATNLRDRIKDAVR
jgi:hypothetical protein